MKTFRNLYPKVYSFENLYRSFRKARKGGKRKKQEVAAFEYHLEKELWRLHHELKTKTYTPGPYRNFYIYERKRRKISAAPFRDRIVHHAIYNVMEPIFEPRFIYDSYACRTGKGTHRAADRAQLFARRCRYVLKCDIKQFFPSIDHAILKSILSRWIWDEDMMWLVDVILQSGVGILDSEYEVEWFPGDDLLSPLRPRGLPIGNLTSQFWANVYLNELDQFVKRQLRCRCYVRYADDFLLFHDDKTVLHQWRWEIQDFLVRLRLKLHANKSVVFPTRVGFDFVGYRIFPFYRRLRKDNVRRFARKLRRLRDAYHRGEKSLDEIHHSIQSWIAHASHANTYRLRSRVFLEVVF